MSKRTGLTTNGCYAAELLDCDGGPTTREHAASEGLLERFGRTFVVKGTPHGEAVTRTPKSMAARVLCERHNGALSPFDTELQRLYDVCNDARDGKAIGWRTLNGHHIERAAIKFLFANAASGIMRPKDGEPPTKIIPDLAWLRLVFDGERFGAFCGFYLVDEPADPDAEFRVTYNTTNNDHPNPDALSGVTMQLVDLVFRVSLIPFVDYTGYRPATVPLQDNGGVNFTWNEEESST